MDSVTAYLTARATVGSDPRYASSWDHALQMFTDPAAKKSAEITTRGGELATKGGDLATKGKEVLKVYFFKTLLTQAKI